MKSKESQLLFERVNKLNDEQKSLISDIIPQIVDLSIHNMLCLFEEHDEFQIIVGGENIADISDGLSGELYTRMVGLKNFQNKDIRLIYRFNYIFI